MLEHSSLFMQITAMLDQVIRLCGWPVFIALVWKFRGTFDNWTVAIKAVQSHLDDIGVLASETKRTVDAVMLNHLQHIQESLVENNVQHLKQVEVLRAIEKGIAVLVDR
jgi:hypothetical protein